MGPRGHWWFTQPSILPWSIWIKDTKWSRLLKWARVAHIAGLRFFVNGLMKKMNISCFCCTQLSWSCCKQKTMLTVLFKAQKDIGILEGFFLPQGGVDSVVFTKRSCQRCLGGRWHDSFCRVISHLFWRSSLCWHFGVFYLPRFYLSWALVRSSIIGHPGRKIPGEHCQDQELFWVSWSSVLLSMHWRLWRMTSSVRQGVGGCFAGGLLDGHWEGSGSGFPVV